MKRKAEEEESDVKRVKIEPVEGEEIEVVAGDLTESKDADVEMPMVERAEEVPDEVPSEELKEDMLTDETEDRPGDGQTIQVIPPTPASAVKSVESEEAARPGMLGEELGLEGKAEIQEGTEEREFEPDLEVELDPEPEES